MKDKTMDFEDRFTITGVRALGPDQSTYRIDTGYRLMFPKDGSRSYFSFFTSKSDIKADYMLKITSIRQLGTGKVLDVFEQDIIDYRKSSDKDRSAGVVIFDKEKLMVAIQDTKTYEIIPFYEAKVFNVLGNIYDNPDFLSKKLEAIYAALKMPYIKEEHIQEALPTLPAEHSYAALDEPVPGLEVVPARPAVDIYVDVKISAKAASWSYVLRQGKNEKADSRPFKTLGKDKGYYLAAAALIALSNIKKPCDIRLHTGSEALHKLLSGNYLSCLEQAGWRKADGSLVSSPEVLRDLKKMVDSIGCTITPVIETAIPA